MLLAIAMVVVVMEGMSRKYHGHTYYYQQLIGPMNNGDGSGGAHLYKVVHKLRPFVVKCC